MKIAPVGDDEAVSCCIHRAQSPAGKEPHISSGGTGVGAVTTHGIADSGGSRQQIHDIAPAQRQVAHFVIRKDCSYRGRRGRDQCIGCDGDFDGLRN